MPNFTAEDFKIEGTTITGLSEAGKEKLKDNGGVIDSFPPEATAIGHHAFVDSGVAVIKDWGNITSIGYGAFFDGKSVSVLPDSWGKVEDIDESAFSLCDISTLPDSWGEVRSIGDLAFSQNIITALPSSWGKVKYIGYFSFCDNMINTVPSTDGVEFRGSFVFLDNPVTEPSYPPED